MTTSAQAVQNALNAGTAVLAFNIPYLPMIAPIVRAIVDTDSFAFLEVARLEWMKFESKSLDAVMDEFRACASLRHVRLHLDHVPVIDEDHREVDYLPIFETAIGLGYDSVMVDGSRLDLAGNIEATKRVADLAHAAGVACEAELGAVFGHGDGPAPPYEELFYSRQGFTDLDEARRFVQETSCDWLSVAIGNIHGAISAAARDQKKVAARLDLDHLARLRDVTNIPLVLHGGSGIPTELLRAAVTRGIAKINVATEVRQCYEAAIRETGDMPAARERLYAKTMALLEEDFAVAGMRAAVCKQDA